MNYLIGSIFNPAASYRGLEPYPQYGNPNYPDGGVHSSVHDLALLTLSILNDGKYTAASCSARPRSPRC